MARKNPQFKSPPPLKLKHTEAANGYITCPVGCAWRAEHEVVNNVNAQEFASFNQTFGYCNVLFAWFRIARRMVMGDNDGIGAIPNCLTENISGVDWRFAD